MSDVRPIDATALQNTITEWRKKEMENDNSITGSAIIDAFGDVLDAISVALTINIDPRWVSVKDRLPEFEDDEPFIRCIVNVIRWSELDRPLEPARADTERGRVHRCCYL